jgi:hypothetical protein
MSQDTEAIDGSKSIDQQERDLNFVEQARCAKVTKYAKGSAGKSNDATIEFLSLSEPQPPPLHLMLAQPGASAGPGAQVIFQANVYVEGVEKRVIGYRPAASSAGG